MPKRTAITKDLDPNYTHDCESCVYLGNFLQKGELYDLYFCGKEGSGNERFVARYGNDGQDYFSYDLVGVMCHGIKYDDHWEYSIIQRAIAADLISPKSALEALSNI